MDQLCQVSDHGCLAEDLLCKDCREPGMVSSTGHCEPLKRCRLGERCVIPASY